MWFKFPEGTTGISVERQNFSSEAIDPKDNRGCFRAPNHFAQAILGQKGFELLGEIPPDFPEDNSIQFPGGGINDTSLAAENTMLKNSLEEMRTNLQTVSTDLNAASANLGAVMHERDQLKLELHEVKTELANLKNDLEDEGIELPVEGKKVERKVSTKN